MTRNNENPSENAGARFVQKCRKIDYRYEIVIFTSSETKAKKMLEKLSVSFDRLKITVSPSDAIKFLCFQ